GRGGGGSPWRGGGVEGLGGRGRDVVASAPADDVDLAVETDRSRRAARARKLGQRPPAVGLGIVLESNIDRSPVRRRREAAEGVDLAVQQRRGEVMAAKRQ